MYLLSCSKGKKMGMEVEIKNEGKEGKKRTALLTWIYGLYSFCYCIVKR